MKKTAGKIILAIIIFVHITSCSRDKIVYNQVLEIPKQTWNYDSLIRFDINIQDTANWYKIIFRVKHTQTYPFANLWIKSIVIAPDNSYRIDTVNIPFLDQEQRWIGKGIGKNWILDYNFADSVRFYKKGKYSFIFQHIMRQQNIKNIKSFGLIIKKLN